MATESWASSTAVRRSMQGNKYRDTGPELALRRALHGAGLRYRVCSRPIPQLRRTVDIVFRPVKIAVEVRGCYWHGCSEHFNPPKTNSEFWTSKIEHNIARDIEMDHVFEQAGWTVLVVWEHENIQIAATNIIDTVRGARNRMGAR